MAKKGFYTNDIPPIEADGKIHHSSNEKAIVFNTFFTSQSSIEGNDDNVPDITRVNICIKPLVLSVADVKNVLKNLNPTKAADLVHNKVLTASSHVSAEALTLLFNKISYHGSLPLHLEKHSRFTNSLRKEIKKRALTTVQYLN